MASDDKQPEIKKQPYRWPKGVSGNPAGRPVGKTLKEWVRERLLNMSEEERVEFLKTVPLDLQWQMAEGRPEQKTETKVQVNTSFTKEQLEYAKQTIINGLNNGRTGDSPPQSSIGTPVNK